MPTTGRNRVFSIVIVVFPSAAYVPQRPATAPFTTTSGRNRESLKLMRVATWRIHLDGLSSCPAVPLLPGQDGARPLRLIGPRCSGLPSAQTSPPWPGVRRLTLTPVAFFVTQVHHEHPGHRRLIDAAPGPAIMAGMKVWQDKRRGAEDGRPFVASRECLAQLRQFRFQTGAVGRDLQELPAESIKLFLAERALAQPVEAEECHARRFGATQRIRRSC